MVVISVAINLAGQMLRIEIAVAEQLNKIWLMAIDPP